MSYNKNDWITLNVGGQTFMTTIGTLTLKEPDSMLARMFSSDSTWQHTRDSQTGAYLIDRTPTYFVPLLNYLRNGQVVIDKNINIEGVLEEAKFFCIDSIIPKLHELLDEEKRLQNKSNTPISRRELVLRLVGAQSVCSASLHHPESLNHPNISSRIRCQGLNFDGADLSKLDLSGINFKYASLRGTNLKGSNLSLCDFERADLTSALLDGAKLMGVRMVCATLEKSSLLGCDFEDSNRFSTNPMIAVMESANMKETNMEGCRLQDANLRLVNLRNSNLKNSDLRRAILAGADLENCNMSGCDFTDANLRGANTKNTSFEGLTQPIHMKHVMSPING